MTRNEFMAALRRRLGHLPAEERDAALKYYEEYFDEAESEEEAARQLGSPDAIADRILADYGASNGAAAKEKKEGRSPWFIVAIVSLCILASPLLIGLGAAAIAAAVTIVILILAAIVGIIGPFLLGSLLLLALFFVLLYFSVVTFPVFAPAGLILLGLALMSGSLGALSGIFTGYLCYWTGLLLKKIFRSGRRRKGANAQ